VPGCPNRFTVTFDAPCDVCPEEITVPVTGGAPPPVVRWTRRSHNGGSTKLQIVLASSLPVGETTTFTLETGLTPPQTNTVSCTHAPAPVIPATSHWGLILLTLLGLTAGTLIARGRATVEHR